MRMEPNILSHVTSCGVRQLDRILLVVIENNDPLKCYWEILKYGTIKLYVRKTNW